MTGNPQRAVSASRITVLAFLLLGTGFLYRASYHWSTRLTVGVPLLDWYAHREFSSRAHFILFLPLFILEREASLSKPGYTLEPDYPRQPAREKNHQEVLHGK